MVKFFCLLIAIFCIILERVKCDKPVISCGSTVCFASGIGSGMVLQQAPSRAALYGSVPDGSPAGVTVTVQLNSTNGDYSKTFSTNAYVVTSSGSQNWKILLDPMSVGGNYTARLTCTTCSGNAASPMISDLTFGDVWLCTGQSNAVSRVKKNVN